VKDLFDLTGQVAVVTGAARGLGKVFAEAYAHHGASLALVGRDKRGLEQVASEISSKGAKCSCYSADITNENEIEKAFGEAVREFGRIDILMNNAGTRRINVAPEEMEISKWKSVIDVNVTGSYICAQTAGRQMIKQKRGRIINISSISGFIINKGVHGGSYDVSKQAIVGMTRALAVEWAKHNINVNAIAPGYFLTIPNKDFFDADPAFYNNVLEMIPMGRIGNPEELAGAAVFLASEASSYMTGSVMVIDGGYTVW
jgi:NAD(P)-dependent dehydrogenase (short-subunit alcohol dehydrogenase family)